jgi:uncharacterized membrane protein
MRSNDFTPRGVRAALLLILAIGLSLRLIGLQRDLWYDEAFSLFNARGADVVQTTIEPNGRIFTSEIFAKDGGWPGVLQATSHSERTPPLYFASLRVWKSIFGESNAAMRALSAMFGVLTLVAVFFLGRALMGEQTALAAVAVLALLPSHIQYSQQVRAYSLTILLTTTASLVFWNASRAIGTAREWRQWALYAGLAATSLYTHYFAAGVLAAHALFALTRQRSERAALIWRLAAVGLIVLVLLAPWILSGYLSNQLGLMQFYESGNPWTLETPKNIARLAGYLVSGWFPAIVFQSVSGVLVLGLYAVGLWTFLGAVRARPDRSPVVFIVLLTVTPVLLVIGAAVALRQPLMLRVPHYLMPAVAGLSLALGVALGGSRGRAGSVMTVAMLLAASAWFQVRLNSQATYTPKPFYGNVSQAVALLNRQISPDSIIVFDHVSLAVTWNIYQRGPLPQIVVAEQPFFFQDPVDFDSAWRNLSTHFRRVTLVRVREARPSAVSTNLAADYHLVRSDRVDDWELRTYERPRDSPHISLQARSRSGTARCCPGRPTEIDMSASTGPPR